MIEVNALAAHAETGSTRNCQKAVLLRVSAAKKVDFGTVGLPMALPCAI
ncbi:hypothetical protein TPR58_10685 [Sphingomonas sp. HF-S3]|uniref:Uncharacterized protein n=1 Tax=Sphingomonas rustica TaxID=3103142 RepID=A0ABV0BA76_9SPHN